MVSYPDAIRSGIGRFSDVRGRSTRAEFWWWWLTMSLISAIIEDRWLATPIILAVFVPTVTVMVRRLHDSGRSAWTLLLLLIPALGLFILLFLLALPSDPGSNRYGPPSPAPAGWSRASGGSWRAGSWDGGDPGPQGGAGGWPQGGAGGWPHGGEEPPRSSGWDDLPPPPPPSR
jgi:uncharacterized membrane protein YhaH (DUF805 family)